MARERPLSPHLLVYKPQLTSMMSICHRLGGIALAAGSLLVVWYIVALATGPSYFAFVQSLLSTWPGQVVLFGYSAAVCYHLCNGIRHLLWDFGCFLSIEGVYRSGYAVIAAAAAMTGGVWYLALGG